MSKRTSVPDPDRVSFPHKRADMKDIVLARLPVDDRAALNTTPRHIIEKNRKYMRRMGTRISRKAYEFMIDQSKHTAFKVACVKRERTMTAMINAFISDFIKPDDDPTKQINLRRFCRQYDKQL